MPGLSISLLGAFQVHCDGRPAVHFETNKARALLAYLAVENRPHTRLHLAGLLWPDWPEAAALTYLRQAVLSLRQSLDQPNAPSPYLLCNRHTIQFNPESDHWLDVAILSAALSTLPRLSGTDAEPSVVKRLAEAAELYRGDFLEGFYLDGCSAFEEWQLVTREELRREAIEATCWLGRSFERHGDPEQAQRWARRSLRLEPLLEESHLRLMRLLALEGERNAALSQYARYMQQLATELDVTPSHEISELYERIKTGRFPGKGNGLNISASSPGSNGLPAEASLPSFLSEAAPTPLAKTLCLARETELALLDARLDRVVSGQGGVVFLTGEAGRGKTVLLRSFAERAQQKHARLVAVGGQCSSHDGIGDALLPFREILAQLTGDFEPQWAAGTVGLEQARRLWSVFPEAVEALLAHGPDLANTLIPGQGLAARAAHLTGGDEWRQQMEALARTGARVAQQAPLFDQFTRLLQALARRRPLLLWIDDLHWVDRASSALLFHLGQRLAGYPLLIAGAYRPEEVSTGSDGERHPLEKVLRELKARFGATSIDLDQAESRSFVDAYVDQEPNSLGAAFREKLHRLTEGHPLFVVELLSTMRERGGLVQDTNSCWSEGPDLEWDKMPSRLEEVIGERVARLPAEQRAVLDVASVEGDEFTAEVAADVLGKDGQSVIRELSGGLDRQHHLVTAVDIRNLGGSHLSHYRFRHILFQKYLYGCLRRPEQRQLHEAVARSLQARTRSRPDQIAVVAGQLARHFEQADLLEQAIPYACLAGERALQLSANEDAVAFYHWGLAMLSQLPDAGEHRALEADLQMGLGTALAAADRHTAAAVQDALLRANQLCRDLIDLPRLFRGVWGLWRFRLVRGEARAALELAQECMEIAQQTGEPSLLVEAHEAVGSTLCRVGKMKRAQEHLARGSQIYDTERLRSQAHLYGQDPGVSLPASEAQVLWYLGYGDQARAMIGKALARAEEWGHTASVAFALIFAAGLHQRARDPEMTLKFAERTIEYSRVHGFGQWVAVGTLYQGWAMFSLGHVEQGLALTQQGFRATLSVEFVQLRYATLLAEVTGLAGAVSEGLRMVSELLERADRLGETEWAAEMHRVKGALLVLQGSDDAAECFEQAISLAQRQGARALELRATLDLARLLQQQRKVDEARQRLSGVYGWFTEGFDMPDLLAAQRLLSELGSGA